MSHCDPDVLALRAMGEPAGDLSDDRHLTTCVACQTELDQLRAVASSARAVSPEDFPMPPPASVWAGIEAELGLTGAGTTAGAEVVDIRSRARRRTWAVGLAAAAVGVLAGVVGTSVLGSSSPTAPTSVVLASSSLAPLQVPGMAGQAVLARTPGAETIEVDVSGVPAAARADGFLEVWLLDPDTGRMIALGALDGSDHGSFVVPPGVDVAAYPTVDVSLEPFDGDPGHSKNSMLRATLSA